jgi:histidyl-tRNA synthetase
MALKLRIMDTIRAESKLFGFQTIGTPALEYADTLLGIGEETDKQSYRFQDHGGRDVGLRFDLTVPFARFVAEHQNELLFPFKKLQMGEVWRGENTQKGRYREFAQCDLDIIGTDHELADSEILALFARILTKLHFGSFTMAVGSRPVLTGMVRKILGIQGDGSEGKISTALISIDKLAKIGEERVISLLVEQTGSSPQACARLIAILSAKDPSGATDLEPIKLLFADDPKLTESLTSLQKIVDGARMGAFGDQQHRDQSQRPTLKIDLSVARGLGYYTGVVFETTIDGLPGFGSVCSGGRYDDLVRRFTDRELPGVGGSIGLDRLVAALEELGLGSVATNPPVFIALVSPAANLYGLSVASHIRAAGFTCEVGFAPKLGAQLKHANRLGVRWAVILGEDEAASATLTLKDLSTGEQWLGISQDQLMTRLCVKSVDP